MSLVFELEVLEDREGVEGVNLAFLVARTWPLVEIGSAMRTQARAIFLAQGNIRRRIDKRGDDGRSDIEAAVSIDDLEFVILVTVDILDGLE